MADVCSYIKIQVHGKKKSECWEKCWDNMTHDNICFISQTHFISSLVICIKNKNLYTCK